jgi:hypothetical protein
LEASELTVLAWCAWTLVAIVFARFAGLALWASPGRAEDGSRHTVHNIEHLVFTQHYVVELKSMNRAAVLAVERGVWDVVPENHVPCRKGAVAIHTGVSEV